MIVPSLEAGSAPDVKGSSPAQERTWPGSGVSERAVSRIVQTIALSSSALLDGTTDLHDSPGTDLPRHVGSLPFAGERSVLTTVHELRGEREAEMFPGAEYLVISRGAAGPLLERVTLEQVAEGTQPLNRRRRAFWQATVNDMAQQDWRVLGVAWRPLEMLPDSLTAEIEHDLSLLALVGVREIAHMPPATERSIARRIALQVLFELDCTTHVAEKTIVARIAAQEAPGKQARYVRMLVTLVRKHLAFLDNTLRNYTIDWPPEQLAIVDRNILRMAILEFAITKGAPVAVVINEAIELARLFSGEESFDFINGVLGAIAAEDAAEVPAEGAASLTRVRALRSYRDSLDRQTELDTIRADLQAVPVNEGLPVA